MTRISVVERNSEREVYAVRFLGGIVLLPAALLVCVIVIVWSGRNGGLTGSGVALTAGMVALGALLMWLMAASWRAVEVTVEPDRLMAETPVTTIFFSPISWRKSSRIDRDDAVAAEPIRTGANRYGVALMPSDRVLVDGFPTRRSATATVELLRSALSRLRDPV